MAITRGPIVLGAKVPTTDVTSFVAGPGRNDHCPGGTLFDVNSTPKLTIKGETFQDEFEPVADKPFTYTAPGIFQNNADADLEFMPFARIHDSRYIMYWKAEVLSEITQAESAKPQGMKCSFHEMQHLNGAWHFTFPMAEASRHVEVYTLSGKQVVDISAPTGSMTLRYNDRGIDLKSGLHVIKILSDRNCVSKKMCVSK